MLLPTLWMMLYPHIYCHGRYYCHNTQCDSNLGLVRLMLLPYEYIQADVIALWLMEICHLFD